MSTTGAPTGTKAPFTGSQLATVLVFGMGTSDLGADHVPGHHGLRQGSPRKPRSALKRFTDGEGDRSEVMFNVEGRTWRTADWATLTGIVSAACFILGGLAGIVLLVVFF